jgi:hypothetical protein
LWYNSLDKQGEIMAIPQVNRTEEHLRNLSLHTETCSLATVNLRRAIETALTIPKGKVHDNALKEAIVLSSKGLVQEKKIVAADTVAQWDMACGNIEVPKTQAKMAAKIARVIGEIFPELAKAIAEKYNAKAGKEQREKTHSPNKGQLEEITNLITGGQYDKAFHTALEVQGPVDRLDAFCRIAARFPLNFQWSPSEQEQIKSETTTLVESLAKIRTLQPGEIDDLMGRCKKLMMRAATAGLPHVVLEIAAMADQQNVKFASIQNGLQRAAFITSIYDVDTAQKMVKMLTIPVRKQEGEENL